MLLVILPLLWHDCLASAFQREIGDIIMLLMWCLDYVKLIFVSIFVNYRSYNRIWALVVSRVVVVFSWAAKLETLLLIVQDIAILKVVTRN